MADDRDRWLLLLGAVIASKEQRQQVWRRVDVNLAPQEIKEFLLALKVGNRQGAETVASQFGFAAAGNSLVDGLVSAISQEQRKARYQQAVDRLAYTKGLAADQFIPTMRQLLDELEKQERSETA